MQVGEEVGIPIEPCRRETFPAIVLATAYLYDVQGVSEDDVVVVCPVDSYVERPYFEMMYNLQKQAKRGKFCLNGNRTDLLERIL